MSAKQLVFNEDARARIVAGVSKLAHAVRGTLGPRARTVVLQRAFGAREIPKPRAATPAMEAMEP